MLKVLNPLLLLVLFGFSTMLNAAVTPPVAFTDPTLEKSARDIANSLNNEIYPAVSSTNRAVQQQTEILEQGLTGIAGVGALFSTPQEQAFRNWTPTAEDLANMIKEGLQTGSLADQIKYYNQKFPIPTASSITPGDPHSVAAQYGVFSAINTNAALSIADKSFDNVQQIQTQINYLYSLIDRQQTLKQGMDLNSAILVRIASLQAELIRLHSQQLKMLAVAQQQGNSARSIMTTFVQNLK